MTVVQDPLFKWIISERGDGVDENHSEEGITADYVMGGKHEVALETCRKLRKKGKQGLERAILYYFSHYCDKIPG